MCHSRDFERAFDHEETDEEDEEKPSFVTEGDPNDVEVLTDGGDDE